MGLLSVERANTPIVTLLPFESSRKWMAVLVKLPNGRYRLLVKGAAEVVFEYCAFLIGDPTYVLTAARLTADDRASFNETITNYANNMLRPVAIAYKDFDASEIFENPDDDPAAVNLEWLASGLIFIGVFGIRDPLRPEVIQSVRKCQDAGVFVRMVTGDNFLTAKAIAASIILLDDNFASIVKALSWGRTVNDAVKKFCQVRDEPSKRFGEKVALTMTTQVSIHHQHHCRYAYGDFEACRRLHFRCCTIALDQPYHGYLCVSRSCHGSPLA